MLNITITYKHVRHVTSPAEKRLFQKVPHQVLIYTPKEAHSEIFVTGGSVFAQKMLMLAKKNSGLFSRRQACITNHYKLHF